MPKYEGAVYRPPSEAYSLIIQITMGCSHNKCTFCALYRDKPFRIKKLDEVIKELQEARTHYSHVEKFFLADGDALIVPTRDLLVILQTIKSLFPECKRVGVYGSAKDINRKTEEELIQLKEAGLGIIYCGLESGNEEILAAVKKNVSVQDMIKAGQKVKKAGIPLSITIISGLGGPEKLRQHALDTAKVLNVMDPEYLGLLTLLLQEGMELYDQWKSGKFTLLNPREVLTETKLLLENLQLTNCIFRANHASNYVPLGGTLPQDKERLLSLIDKALAAPEHIFKSENQRLL